MALSFPSSPTNGQTYTYNGDTYTFDGKRWTMPASGSGVASSTQIEFLRGTATSGSASIITANEQGTVLLAKQESSDDTWYTFNGTNTLTVNRAGILTIDLNQDIKTSTNTGYTTIYIYKNAVLVHRQLIQNTNGEWDCAVTSHYTEVVPGDTIDIVFTSPVDILMFDPGVWSYYNFMLIENSNSSGIQVLADEPITGTPGQMYYNSTSNGMFYYNGSYWVSIAGAADGSSPGNAAESAMAIKQLTNTTQDGLYWISVPGYGVQQVYCDMNTDGGGWMHVGTFSDNNETTSQVSGTLQQEGGVHPWGAPAFPTQDLGLWEDNTTLGTQSFTNDFKSAVWSTIPMTQMLMKDSGGSLRNLFYTNTGQITSQTLSSWFGSLTWGATGSDNSSAAYAAGRVTGLNITNFGVVDPALESGNKSVMLFKFGEADGVQDGNKDRTVIARHAHNATNGVDAPSGIGCFRSADPSQSGWYQRWRDIVPNTAGWADEPPTNITGAPYNYTMWVR